MITERGDVIERTSDVCLYVLHVCLSVCMHVRVTGAWRCAVG